MSLFSSHTVKVPSNVHVFHDCDTSMTVICKQGVDGTVFKQMYVVMSVIIVCVCVCVQVHVTVYVIPNF